MSEVITFKPRIGISACVYRCPVRYNRKAFDALAVLGREAADFVFTPVCPEVMSGLGVPRVPIHLTGPGHDVLRGEAVVRDRRGRDVTGQVVDGARACLEALERAEVDAVVVKEASPSCGVYKARVGKKRTEQVEGSGVFGAMLLETGWFLIPDSALASPLLWWDWRRRFHAWLWLRRRPLPAKRDVYEAWHVLKFLVQEIDRPYADRMGHELAGMKGRLTAEEAERFRTGVMDVLRRPSTRPRIRQAMWKTYVNAKKHGRLDGVDLHELDMSAPEVTRNITSIVADLTKLERVSFENDLLFGTSPVIMRDASRVRVRDAERSGQAEE